MIKLTIKCPGTIVHSDEWKAYNKILKLPHMSSHEVVNHSVNFVDPASGVHTQNIKSYWNNVKQKLKRMKGCHGEQLVSRCQTLFYYLQ